LFRRGGTFGTGHGGRADQAVCSDSRLFSGWLIFGTDGPDKENYFINRRCLRFGYRLGEGNEIRLTLRNNTSNAQTPGQTLLLPPNLDQHNRLWILQLKPALDFVTGKHWHHQFEWRGILQPGTYCKPRASFFATDPVVGCPQDPSGQFGGPRRILRFPFSLKNRYNRASVNAHLFSVAELHGTGGYQYEWRTQPQSLDPNDNLFLTTFAAKQPGRLPRLSLFTHPRATISFGGRAEANSVFGIRVAPRVGASLALLQDAISGRDAPPRYFSGEGIKEAALDQTK